MRVPASVQHSVIPLPLGCVAIAMPDCWMIGDTTELGYGVAVSGARYVYVAMRTPTLWRSC